MKLAARYLACISKVFQISGAGKNVSEISASYRDIFDIFFNIFLLSNLDLTPNCDNTRDLHPSLRGNVNLEVTFKEATQTTITVLMYTASSGGISVGKDFDVQMLSSDY